VGLHERGDLRVTLAVGRLCGQHADYLPVVDLERRLGLNDVVVDVREVIGEAWRACGHGRGYRDR
jgi:hypothetical protein